MTANEIRTQVQVTARTLMGMPEDIMAGYIATATLHIQFEIAAQLAELNETLRRSSDLPSAIAVSVDPRGE